MGYLPQHALANLRKYSYKGVDKSLLSRHVLNPYWNWLVTLWPTWVAPNVITLSGLMMVLLNFATLLYYDPAYLTEKGGAAGPPHWLYFTWAAGLFIYQSFDAIDGKQARRTGMAGPLGEMFDHGCDALNTTLEAILCCYALNLGRSWWTVASQIATLANFYLTTWEEYYTGQLYLGVFSGPVEGILLICIIYVITGLYGPSFWDHSVQQILPASISQALAHLPLPLPPALSAYLSTLRLNEAFMLFGAFGLAFNIVTSYINVFRARLAAHLSPFRPLLHLLPFPLTAGLQLAWLAAPAWTEHGAAAKWGTRSAILHSPLAVPFLCAWGLQFAHQVGRMILAHVTKTAFPTRDALWLWSALGALDAGWPALTGRAPLVQHNAHNVGVVVGLTLALSALAYARWCARVIGEVTNFLGIACFTVRKKDVSGQWRRAASVDKVSVGKKQ